MQGPKVLVKDRRVMNAENAYFRSVSITAKIYCITQCVYLDVQNGAREGIASAK